MITLSSFSCLSVVSFAAVIPGGERDEEDNLVEKQWEFDDSTGILTVYADITDNSWLTYKNDIVEVVFKENVENIKDFMFADLPSLVNIAFEVALKTIGIGAFQNCDKLTTVSLLDAETIKDYAFFDCDSLSSVEMGGRLTNVGKNIFKECDSLKTVAIANGVTQIGEGMFEDCVALEEADLPDSVEEIGRLAFENCTALKQIKIPDSTVSVGEYAFYGCSSATSAYIGHNVSEIGEYAFGKCSALESVEIKCAMPAISEGMFYGCSALKGLTNLPEGIKTIGKNAFKDCTSFSEINIPATVIEIGDSAFDSTVITTINIPVGVELIGSGAFTNCNKLSAINVEAKNRFYASVDGVLYNADISELICCPAGKTGTVVVKEGTEAIGNDAFIGCTGVDVIEIPGSVTAIATNAFNGCAAGLKIKANCDSYAAEYAKLYAIDIDITHSSISEWIITVEPTCESAGVKEKQCEACGNVEETGVVDALGHNYDDGVVTKKAKCEEDGIVKFTCQNAGCDSYYTEVIPATGHNYDDGTVTLEPTCENDGKKVFRCQNEGCYTYYEITLPATGHNMDDGTVRVEATCTTNGEKVYKCQDEACNYKTTEVIPAFGHNYDDGVVTIEPICEVDGVKTFTCKNDCGTTYTEAIPATNHNYDDGVITKYPTVKAEGEITFTCKNSWCTEDHANHTYTVAIPNTAFDGILATNEGAYVDENGSIQELTWLITDEYDLFIYADDTAEEWAPYRNNIVSATITGEATTVANGSFAYMPALTEVNILFSLGTIEAYAFQYCENLKTVFTGSIEEIQEFVFYGCKSLESVDIYGGLPEDKVGKNIFLDCTNLSEVILRNGCLVLGEAMFKGCSSLEEIVLPESLLVIGDSAFDGTSIKEIRIPTDVKEIQKGVFTRCTELEAIEVDVKNDNYFSFDGALYDMALGSLLLCPAGKKGELTVWDSTTKIAEDAFIGCVDITKVTIPRSVTEIAANAFNGCSEGLIIACDCDSVAAKFAETRRFATELTHVGNQVWQVTAEATCLEAGSKELVCSGCGYSYEVLVVDALGHNYDNGVVTTKATCEADGLKTVSCTRTDCNYSYTEVIPNLGGHKYKGVVTIEPTCEVEGVKTFTCQNTDCDDSYTETIAKLGHKYDKGVVTLEPTCEEAGVKTFTCQNADCDDSYTEAIEKLGHKYDKGVVTLEATCEADGIRTFTCQNAGCEDSYTEVIPALTHNYVENVVRKGNCITKGLVKYECEHCRDSYEVKEFGEHQLYSYAVTVEATCDKEGKTGKMCALCHEFVGEVTTTPATGHTEGKWIIDKNATAEAAGKKHKECKDCGKTLKTEAIPQLKCARPEIEKVTNVSKGVKIKWTAESGADYYRVYRRTKNGEWKYLDSTKKTSFTDDTAKSGTKYYYSVRAINEAGISSRSNSLSKYYLEDPSLTSVTNTKSGVTIKWSKVKGADRYIIYRRTESGSYKRIKTVDGASTVSYTNKTVTNGTKYYYKVKALYSKTTSDYSNARSVTVK